MIKFINRLTNEQISAFFNNLGTVAEIKTSHNEDMFDVYFFNSEGNVFWYSIADNYICAPGFCKTSEDWKLYMSELFGEEYITQYEEMPVENEFIPKLNIEDLETLFQSSFLNIASIEEVTAFRKGTRRFKVTYCGPFNIIEEKEYIVGPHLDFCSQLFTMKGVYFIEFMVKKFGMDFINFYTNIDRKKLNREVEEFKAKCDIKLKERINFMKTIWEKSIKEE